MIPSFANYLLLAHFSFVAALSVLYWFSPRPATVVKEHVTCRDAPPLTTPVVATESRCSIRVSIRSSDLLWNHLLRAPISFSNTIDCRGLRAQQMIAHLKLRCYENFFYTFLKTQIISYFKLRSDFDLPNWKGSGVHRHKFFLKTLHLEIKFCTQWIIGTWVDYCPETFWLEFLSRVVPIMCRLSWYTRVNEN